SETEGNKAVREAEERLRSFQGGAAKEREAINELHLRLQQKSLEREHLHRALLDRFRCNLEEEFREEDADWDDDRQETRRQELQQQLENIGEVNLTALEEYQALEERLAFLVAQQTDLKTSVADLETT